MSYQEALKILGFPLGSKPMKDQINIRFKKLAKKYHPDLIARASQKAQADLTTQFQKINEAKQRLQRQQQMLSRELAPGYEKYLKRLQNMIPIQYDAEKMSKIIAEEARRVSRMNKPDEDQKFQDAIKAFNVIRDRQKEWQYIWKSRNWNIFRTAARRSALSWEERELDMLQQKALDQAIKNVIDSWLNRLSSVLKKVVFIKNKPKVPINFQYRKKRVTKYVLLTTSMLVAILGGKYVWDKSRQAFIRKRRAIMVI